MDQAVVGWILDRDAALHWRCGDCGGWGEADAATIARALGRTFSLLDQHPPCRRDGCLGRVTFYVGQGLRWTPLYSDDAARRALVAAGYPERPTLLAHGWRIAAGLWRPPVRRVEPTGRGDVPS